MIFNGWPRDRTSLTYDLSGRSIQSKVSLRRRLFLVTFTGFVLSVGPLSYLIYSSLQPTASAQVVENSVVLPKLNAASAELPVHLKIPKIKVDADLEYVGTTAQGAMATPHNPNNAAWFDKGPHPGDKGNAVIDGHFGLKDKVPAVFDSLNKLQKGDRVSVIGEKGAVITFVVRETRKYDPKADAADVFGSSDNKAHLNLITCEGSWNESLKSYSNRLVIFTDRET